MEELTAFSIRARKESIHFAWEGILAFFTRQHNAIIYLVITLAVFIAALALNCSRTEFLVLILVTGMVWSAEIFNTAIEAIMDHISPDQHPAVKFIKDVSAAAVLMAAFTALLSGLIIFIPKIL